MKTRWRTLVVAENAAGEALAAKLRADGHYVDIARSGREALERAREQQYVTYFIEFDVAGMDGVEIMKEIRRVQPGASIIVTCPGSGTREDEFVSMAQRAAAGQTNDLVPITLAGETADQRDPTPHGRKYQRVGHHSRHRSLYALRKNQEVRDPAVKVGQPLPPANLV
jgi:CheY-like chemotaxis protein